MVGCRALWGVRKFSPSREEWDPSPPLHHCPGSDDSMSELTWAWPSCYCHICKAHRITLYTHIQQEHSSSGDELK